MTKHIASRALLTALTLAAATACTVKDVDAPQFAGPSGLARTIIMTADRDTLLQDGIQQAAIQIVAQVQPGQSENVRLRAQVFVDGVAQDFGTLSNKTPITPTTIFYRAPAAPANANGQLPTTVTIAVTPDDSGDFRGEFTRQIDIRLIPPGVILPVNPNLAPDFTFTPASPQVLTVVNFDASTTTNGGEACPNACTYAWDFGDGTTASGRTTTHQFRSVGNFPVALTVSDHRGASATITKAVSVAPGTPPGTTFTISPQNPGVNQPVFFNATQAAPAAGRTIVSYEWSFGDGNFGSGIVTQHTYQGAGAYQVQLVTTDDAGSIGRSAPTTLTVGGAVGPNPTADLVLVTATPMANLPVSFNASASLPGSGSSIVSYSFDWGDGTPLEVQTNPLQTHVYTAPGTFVVTVTVTDSLGRTASKQVEVTVS